MRSTKWDCLWYVGRGLGHLHDRGIVHGDLKGNNILVGEDETKAKLADFGLSFVAAGAGAEEHAASAAVRWEAPECLRGQPPTFASDIYSFGMCIIEVISEAYPWGNVNETAIKAMVLQGLLPPRGDSFTDDEWDLVQRMCRFHPADRICAAAVSRIAYEIGDKAFAVDLGEQQR